METLTVTQFNQRVQTIITSNDAIRELALVGEISKVTVASSGHMYLDLKEGRSLVKCTCFRFVAGRLKFSPKAGMKVIAYGSASFYSDGGSFNFNIEGMEEYGKGDAQKALEELTEKLKTEGLFEKERKRPIPRYPRSIGVVTSRTGAVIKDIIDTVSRRKFPVDILLCSATVQGDDAPKSIVSSLNLLQQQNVDVIIVGRGGGSKEDLIAFNSEDVVRTVASCRVPVISAVGHATDVSLCDLVADGHAETPTAAAMMATPDADNERKMLDDKISLLNRSLKNVVQRMKSRYELLETKLSPKNASFKISGYRSDLNSLSTRMDSSLALRMNEYRSSFESIDSRVDIRLISDRISDNQSLLDELIRRSDEYIGDTISDLKNRYEVISAVLDSTDPKKLLLKGYSFITDDAGKVLTSIDQIGIGSDINIKLKDGTVIAKVKELKNNG